MSMRHIGAATRPATASSTFRRTKDNVPAVVETIEYDPNRSPRIALIKYKDGERRYIPRAGRPQGRRRGDVRRKAGAQDRQLHAAQEHSHGQSHPQRGADPGRGGQLARSAGTFAQLMAKEGNYADVVLPSGEVRKIHIRCRATVGKMGNSDWAKIVLGKAGRKRWYGVRPTVRGKAMNPVSHPCGGGDGRGGVGRQPCNWKGTKLAKGGKTRRSKKPSQRFIVRFRRTGPHQANRR
jgi:large subunit ribosomal protein L2